MTGRGKNLDIGGDPESGLPVHRSGIAHAPNAISLGQQHLAVLHHSERQPGHLERLHHLRHIAVEIGGEGRLLGGEQRQDTNH